MRVLIMAGGTGGHVFPALAVAQCLRAQGDHVAWLGTQRGLEAKVVPAADIPIRWVDIRGLRGKGITTWFVTPFRLLRAVTQCLRTLKDEKPDVVLGMGGYVSVPGALAAVMLGKPFVLHEQNAVPGMSNKLLARFAKRIFRAFDRGFDGYKNVTTCGNPLREAFVKADSPRERYTTREGALRVLIVGGSLGAKYLNETVPEALKAVNENVAVDVWHQSGEKMHPETEQAYQQCGLTARVTPFIEDMAEAYRWSDIVICRSGALTVSEIAAIGVPAIFVPYPYAVDDHQTVNARYLSDSGAAWIAQQAVTTSGDLAELLIKFVQAYSNDLNEIRAALADKAVKAQNKASYDAVDQIVKTCRALFGKGRNHDVVIEEKGTK